MGLDTQFAAPTQASGSFTFGDDEELFFGNLPDAAIKWATDDTDNHTLVLGLGDSNQSFHITDLDAMETNWGVAAQAHPTLYIHSNTTPASDYITIGSHDGTNVYYDLVGGTTVHLQIAGLDHITYSTAVVTINDGGIDRDFIAEGVNNTNLLVVDAGNDNVGIGGAPSARTFLQIVPGAQSRALQTSIGWAINLLADTVTSTNTDTDAIGAYVFIGTPTLAATSATYTATLAATVYIEAAPVVGSNAAIGDGYALLIGAGSFATNGRILGAQGADVASTNNLVLGTDGNVFEITGTTDINLLSNIGWQNGSTVRLMFTSTATVKDAQATSTTNITILLDGSVDFDPTAGDTIELTLSEIGGTQAWRETGSRNVL